MPCTCPDCTTHRRQNQWSQSKRDRFAANAVHHWFPPHAAYALARKCPTCKAAPGVLCHVQSGTRQWHSARTAAAIKHFMKDEGRAPRLEDRVLGTRYDTLKPTPTPNPEADRPHPSPQPIPEH